MADGFITRRGGGSASTPPVFTYTGEYTPIDDGDNNWRIKFYTSGTLTFTDLGNAANGIDVFLVGGGGSGSSMSASVAGAAGGGGGYTTTGSIIPQKDTPYTVVIGAGGIGASLNTASGKVGGQTTAFNLTANGGQPGGYDGTWWHGGPGGSGGASAGGNGGSDGGNGFGDSPNAAGQGSTTREFGEDTGDLYAGGGGAAPTYYNGWGSTWLGGAGGGGNGSAARDFACGYPGVDGLGGGGGGGRGNGGDGGSGIVVIRNKR